MSWLKKQWSDIWDRSLYGKYKDKKEGEISERNDAIANENKWAALDNYGRANAGPVAGAYGTGGTAGTIAGPGASFRQTPGLVVQPGINPFLAAAAKQGMTVAPIVNQAAMATALRGGNDGQS
jgi:hypothetical protein